MTGTDDHTVLKFRPRRLSEVGKSAPGQPAPDLSGYSDDPSIPDDYRHRMVTNAAAFMFAVALASLGVWLAIKLADLRAGQDCVLMGRSDCAHISSTVRH